LDACETWSLTLRAEHKLRVFENRVLRRISGPKRDEVTGWRIMHNELHILYSLQNIIRIVKLRRMRWEGHVVDLGEMKNEYTILVGKPEGKRPRRRWRIILNGI
jgi:hypothetical protein